MPSSIRSLIYNALKPSVIFCLLCAEWLGVHGCAASDTGAYHTRQQRGLLDKEATRKDKQYVQHPLAGYTTNDCREIQAPPRVYQKGVVLPVPSNQRMNSYLKEIADVCGIKKTLSTHIARHTFACIAIANKVSMESIAKMLGHSDLRTTKIYAKLMDKTVSEEMNVLKRKFSAL